MVSKLDQLAALGQAVWLDFIRRSFITSGEMGALVAQGLRGMTSNPSIFQKAIAGSADYDEDLSRLVREGRSVNEIYEALVIADIQQAADALRPVFEASDGLDGYVSLEVDPTLAHDAASTVAEARRLFTAVDRPNVMIKVPATPAGIPATTTLVGEGINVNVTLIFSVAHYVASAEAYLAGLERLAETGGDLSKVASVASVFVSRVDTAVDSRLKQLGAGELRGKAAVANAKMIYQRFRRILAGERWQRLAARGARPQRVLWASTSAKDPSYRDTLYVDDLIGAHTVNTLPPATLDAFRDHGTVALTVEEGLAEAESLLTRLEEVGVGLEAIMQTLQDAGVRAFADSFRELMASIAARRDALRRDETGLAAQLGPYQAAYERDLARARAARVMERIWTHDYTLWSDDSTEITDRLGWLWIAQEMPHHVERIEALADGVRREGLTHALLFGMGGSSLAPEVFRKAFGVRKGYLDLRVLDSTDPGAVRACQGAVDLARTLFIGSSKSGTTTETLSFLKYFYNQLAHTVSVTHPGQHFVAITDPGTPLARLAGALGFRELYENDPNIGGRYSALSYYGLVPAALLGVDLRTLLARAVAVAQDHSGECPAARLGTMMAALAAHGRDKLTLITSPRIVSLSDWIEQLIAESTGKEGRGGDRKGILPVVGEALGSPGSYGADRFFVYLRLAGDAQRDAQVQALAEAGYPVIWLNLSDMHDLGGQFFLWEMATAVAGHHLGIQPFDQPDVDAAKERAREMIEAYTAGGARPVGEYAALSGDVLGRFLSQARSGDYVAIHAYVQPTPEADAALSELRAAVRERTGLAMTVGYGPRFLHSTGQLHKGGPNKGLFVQLISAGPELPIPDAPGSDASSVGFGLLKLAQALGDRRALTDKRRRVITFHLGSDVESPLRQLARELR
ncbi:MAG: bifunctional transaldolase/phosoglucose isomerase [Chloroflexi bacterium]|nr:bifunctional transaldolase/phosoglucose isomerase [Chloroflexota bacterium]